MHLESLSLRGFKSFERRIEIRFDRRLTAVVGPNGSGKSNIADAIRWVLGEQSMQALRSKNLVDLIFAGTDRRLPVNAAEVVLTVNNEDGALPVPYAQVAVTRRVYRAGESEFYINGIPCRLREIHQLFLDTGVGRRGISLVGQGEIDALLTATPEQRRGWVEDLAGIARYQLQKQQALAKVETARQELTRLQDLIVEVRAQRDRLQAEALRARRHREMIARLRRAEWRLYLLLRQAAEERVVATGARLAELRRRLEGAQEAYRQRAEEVRVLRAQLAELREEVALHDDAARRLQERAARLDRDEGILAVERRQAAQALRAHRAELSRLRAQMDERFGARRQAWRERRQAAQAVALAEVRLEEAQRSLQTVPEPPQAAGVDLAGLRARVTTLRESLATRWAEERARAQAIQERRDELEGLARGLEEREAALGETQEASRRLGAEAERLKDEREARATALAAAEAVLREAEEARSRAEREAVHLRTRLNSLRQVIAEGQGYALGPRLVLQERSRFPGLVGSVAELLQVPGELARAAEAALGGAGQHLVTRDEGAVRAAIAWLKAEGRGRATFLPLDRLRPAPPLPPNHPARRGRGVVGVLAELAGVREGFEILLIYLFGRTVVLQDLDSALALQKSDAMPGGGGARLVTLEGELLLPSGAVTGGATRQDAGGLITRQSELAELEEQVARAGALLMEATGRLKGAQAAVQEARKAHDRAESAWREAVGAERARLQELQGLQREVEALRARIQEGQAALGAREAERERLRAEAQELSRQLEAAEAELERAEGEASLREEALEAARTRAEEARAVVAEARLARQEAVHRFQEANRRWEEARAAWRAWREQLRRAAEEPLAGTRRELARRREELRQGRMALGEEQGRLEEELRARRQEVGRLEADLARREEQASEAAGRVETTREEAHAAELDLVRERAELEHLLQEAPLPPEEDEDPPGAGAEAAAAREAPTDQDVEAWRQEVQRLRAGLARLGAVNPVAEEAFQEVDTRFRNLESQRDDLLAARRELTEMVETIDRTSTERFREAFTSLQEAMHDLFQRLFGGGEARLELTRPDDPLQSGVELNVRPPGKRWQPLMALSGGERSLCLVALIFAMQKVRPSAFALLDEVDAALDRRNLVRFVSVLEEFSARTQFVLISHRPETVEAARVLYGATLDGDGTSRLVSLRVPEPEEVSS